MTGIGAGDDPLPTGANVSNDDFAQAVHGAYREVRLHSPQAIPEVEERLRGKLAADGITLTADVLRALAFAIVNDRGM